MSATESGIEGTISIFVIGEACCDFISAVELSKETIVTRTLHTAFALVRINPLHAVLSKGVAVETETALTIDIT